MSRLAIIPARGGSKRIPHKNIKVFIDKHIMAYAIENCDNEYVAWLNDDEVNFYLETGGHYTIQKLRQFLTDIESNKNILFGAINIKVTNKHIGNIEIDPISIRHNRGEYGIMLGEKSEWGKGFAREATNAIMNYCFEEKKLHKIIVGVVENCGAVELFNSGFLGGRQMY